MKGITQLALVVILMACQGPGEKDQSIPEKEIQVVHDTVYVEKLAANDEDSKGKGELSEYQVMERLPDQFMSSGLIKSGKISGKYVFDQRMNPLYLEADFNGGGELDIALPIKDPVSGKRGIAVYHSETKKIHILGAGVKSQYGVAEDLAYADIWKVNRDRENEAGLEEEGGPLILEHPSIQIETSEIGGGQLYWNGKAYAYFHQTC
ncbi:MAG: hypothetical protein EP338_06295 [Bacteroidetes bacterium]|nr:MAG: hypothetical protein EP338_06295 [Bacteroidota bacterium]